MIKSVETFSTKIKPSSEDLLPCNKSLILTILNNTYLLDILSIKHILVDVPIFNYQTSVKCGFVKDGLSTILVFDIKNNAGLSNNNRNTIIVVKAHRNNSVVTMGFNIDTIDSFLDMLH